MIVRDEEDNMAACLTSIKPWVDEMIVVDTGSVDRTVEIARECGARVEHFEWCDSFSAARNESLKHATGDWIFWMDADDVIDAENGRQLRELVAGVGEDTFGITVRVHCPPRPGEHAGTEIVDHVKLIRNHPDVRFEFHIHEQILPSIRRQGKEIAYSEVFVTHAGYDTTPAGQTKKRERDLKLLQLDLADHPEHPFVHFNIGMTAYHTDDLDAAAKHLQSAIDFAAPTESHVRKAYALLAGCHRRRGEFGQARETCDAGLATSPDDPELLFNRAIASHELRDHAAAEESYLRILALGDGETYLRSVDSGIGGFKTRHNLAVLYRDMGREADAKEQLRLAVTEEPNFLPSWQALAELSGPGDTSPIEALVDATCNTGQTRGTGELVRARLLASAGRPDQALTHAQNALAAALGPNWTHAQRLHAELLSQTTSPSP